MSLAALVVAGGGAQASGGGGGGSGDGPHLVELEPIQVPIIESDRVSGTLNLKLALNAADDQVKGELAAAQPELRAAALGAVLEFARLRASPFRAVDAAELDHELSAALGHAKPGIAKVLIVEVSATRL